MTAIVIAGTLHAENVDSPDAPAQCNRLVT
jgi:hypothetical protein